MQRWLVPLLVAIVVWTGLSSAGGHRPDDAAATSGSRSELVGRTIHVDAGHNGGNDSHATEINRLVNAGGGVRKACDTTGTQTSDGTLTESAFTLDVALRLRTRLRARGATVVMTRTTNRGVGPCITRRAAIGNEAEADAAISIHADGGPSSGRGFHVIRPGGIKGQAKALLGDSSLLSRRVRTALRAKGYKTATYIGRNGLDTRTDLGGLNLSKVPKVLVELGNMRNEDDAALFRSTEHRGRLADALAAALVLQLASGR